MSIAVFVQQFLNGLQLGSLYALIALGYTMVYGVLLLINFAHGDIFMIGAFLGVFATFTLKLPFIPTLILSMALTAALGVTIERVAYKPLRHASRLSAVITALGVGLLLENGMLALTGAKPRSYPEDFIHVQVYNIGDFSISNVKILTIVLAALLFTGLYTLVQRTKWGMAMRAISYDKFALPLMGVSQDQIIALTFILGFIFLGVQAYEYHHAYAELGLLRVGNLVTIALLLPITYLGVRLGYFLNHKCSDKWFNRLIYGLLTLTGLQLVSGFDLLRLIK